MSGLDNTLDSLLGKRSDQVLGAVRIVSAYMFMLHGTQKMFSWPVAAFGEYNLMSLAPGLAGLLEVVGGLLLLVGLFTRPVAFVLSGLMAFAYWMAHAPRDGGSFLFPVSNGGDAAVLYCFIFLYIAAVGGGAWSIDGKMKGS
ncbi:MAG: DoxX family protein [Candidatus Rariloculaceae bacterium]